MRKPECVTFPTLMLAVVLLALSVSVRAVHPPTLLKKVGVLIDSMSVRGLDRHYIDAPQQPWQLIVKSNMGQSSLDMKASGNIGGFARLSVTYNFGRYFLNAYGQFNSFRYHHNDSHGRLDDWFVNTAIGIRL